MMTDDDVPSIEVGDTSGGVAARKIHGIYVVPPNATRVKVSDDKGKICWRKIDEVRDSDALELDKQSQPIYMTGTLGRPAANSKQASNILEVASPSNKLVGDLIKFKHAQTRTDPVILAAESTPESPEVLNQVLLAIAEEAASLRFERSEAERQGNETSTLSMRRVAALKAIGDTWIKRKEQIANRAIDLDSTSFHELFRFISETFARAMDAAGVRSELANSVFAQFSKLLDDEWKKEAKTRMSKD
jgi:hypothetical protein